jgi:predicted SAM-dependent methyltransferase
MTITINKEPGGRILELGGGQNRHPASDVNVDVRPGPGVDFVANFEDHLPIRDRDFEGVFCQYALEHISYPKLPRFLKEVLRVLKPGGKAVFVVPNTLAQLNWIQNNPQGWDNKDLFTAASELLFGTLDYPENSHKAFLSPDIATKLFTEAGFENIVIQEYNERLTDMCVSAARPLTPLVEEVASQPAPVVETKLPVEDKTPAYTRPELFDKHYFDGGKKVGGYANEGYRDFPVHEITVRHILERKPASVLEIGCARGYLLKRLQDRGVPCVGMEISKHCLLTRATDIIHCHDMCDTPWPLRETNPNKFDLCFSIAVMEHIPEKFLPAIILEMKKHCERGLMGIDFGHKDDGFDKTHCTLRPKSWWEAKFKEFDFPCEVVDKELLEAGPFPEDVLKGDGKNKINVGSFTAMFHNGWTNIDQHDLRQWAAGQGYNFCHLDVRQGMPFNTGSVDLIFSSHFLEHLTYKEGLTFLRDCRRVIKPDGALRIMVPDAHLLTDMYIRERGECGLAQFDELNHGCAEAPTPAAKLWALLHEGHSSCYDQETLRDQLIRAGFMVPNCASWFRQALVEWHNYAARKQIVTEVIEPLPSLSLIMEAVPEVG